MRHNKQLLAVILFHYYFSAGKPSNASDANGNAFVPRYAAMGVSYVSSLVMSMGRKGCKLRVDKEH